MTNDAGCTQGKLKLGLLWQEEEGGGGGGGGGGEGGEEEEGEDEREEGGGGEEDFSPSIGLKNLRVGEGKSEILPLGVAVCGAETWTLNKVDRSTWKVLKYIAGEGWRRSVGPIVCEMKKCYNESRRSGISYVQ